MGRKKKTLKLKEKSQPSWTMNCSAPARNLRKSDLGAIIFGCKNNTINECYSELLFGLPAPHFAYVRNIKPGLPVFLFNYSDRKLHGIFEATSPGQMNIDPYGWTADGAGNTPYPAQVRVRIRMQCQSLFEDQFGPIIADNYYESRLFWFELDHAQTHKLITLFSSSPVPASTSICQNTARDSLPTLQKRETGRKIQLLEAQMGVEAAAKYGDGLEHPKSNCQQSQSTTLYNSCASLPQKKWSSLFETSTISGTIEENDDTWIRSSEFTFPCSDQSNMEWGSKCVTPDLDGESQLSNASRDVSATETPDLDGESQLSDASTDVPASEIYEEEHVSPRPDSEGFFVSVATEEVNSEFPEGRDFSETVTASEVKSSDLHSLVAKLMQELEGLKTSQLKHVRKISYLEQELVKSNAEIERLKNQSIVVESGSLSSRHIEEATYESFKEPHSKINDEILIVGGFDGSSWLSTLGSYSPSQDTINPLRSMSSVRSYASAALLSGELYMFGGVDGNVWNDTAESYNPTSDQWVSRPSLNEKKGSLAGASLCNKIFAIGGGNGGECYSTVEMFDINIGRWIATQSMRHKRMAPAAAEIDGTLYVVGGYDGRDYLESVERFDPREHSWTTVGSMSKKRGCHSLVVLNEKLYALGGYVEGKIVSSVEIFDPRVGSWMIGEPMKESRGNSGVIVIGEQIFVIGGRDNEKILDTIECYKEGYGWEVTDLKGIGKRCFFSAVVL